MKRKIEKDRLRKVLVRNKWIPQEIRSNIRKRKGLENYNKRNYCLISKNKRSLFKDYSLGRHSYKRLVLRGNIMGERKGQW